MLKNRLQGLARMAYVICYAILIIYLLNKIKQCVENYYEGTTFYETSMVKQDDTTFPEITLCAETHLGLKEDVLKVIKKFKLKPKRKLLKVSDFLQLFST